jgi:tetratricopeptide (TPR) repeat protein
VETDEDPLDEILHPEESEKDMERMEQSMKRMVDMQKQGADIYFGGFSQMKRYPFFNDICNWFMPFSGNHPAISNIWNREKGHRFLDVITRVGAFCDSDKYSFVLAFDMVMERLPKSMLKLVEQGEASPIPIGGEIDEDEQQQPAFLRRMYLQDMYRFYKLYSARSEFRNPFASEQSILLFFANPLVKGSELERQFAAVARFLMKRHRNKEAMDVLENLTEQNRNFQYYMMMGNILQHVKNSSHISAMECFRKALQLQPDNDKAQAGYARTLFNEQYFDMALKEYRSMLNRNPNHQGYQLRAAVCMTNLGQADEALKLLFKLNYENPEDDTVNRVLAWTMTIAGKYEQAEKIYCRLLDAEVTEPTDMLNYGYNLWFSGKIDTAAGMFRQYCEMQHDNAFSIENEILVNERQLIANHGIGDTEMLLMVDAVENG